MTELSLGSNSIDKVINILMTDEKLLDYITLLVSKRLSHINKFNSQACLKVVDLSIEQVLNEIDVISILKYLKINVEETKSSIQINNVNNQLIQPTFSSSEPKSTINNIPRKIIRKLNKHKNLDELNKTNIIDNNKIVDVSNEKNQILTSINSDASTVRMVIPSNDIITSKPNITTMSALLNLDNKLGKSIDCEDIKSTNTSISTLFEEENLIITNHNSMNNLSKVATKDNSNEITNKLKEEVDLYINNWENQIIKQLNHQRDDNNIINESLDSWEQKIRKHLNENQQSDDDKSEYSVNNFENYIDITDDIKENDMKTTISNNHNEYYNSTSINSNIGNVLFFDQSRFDSDADFINNGGDIKKTQFKANTNIKRNVHFPSNLISDVQYRDYFDKTEKELLFYNHAEEMQFKIDQMKESERADAVGLSWVEWMEYRTDEDVALDDEEDTNRMYEDDNYEDNYEDNENFIDFEDDMLDFNSINNNLKYLQSTARFDQTLEFTDELSIPESDDSINDF